MGGIGDLTMTLTDIVNRPKPYTQEEFMEGLIETCSDKTREVPWKIVVVTPEREDIKFKSHDEAIGFLFDRIFCFNWHVGSFAFSPSMNYLYIALFKNDG